MGTINIQTSWHKATDTGAMSFKQLSFIGELRNSDNCPEWPFNSSTNAMRSITKHDASEIIDALKNGKKITFNK